MTIESILTRELELRFIDARALATEARVSLGIHGYPTQEEEQQVVAEAVSIFERRPSESRRAMQSLKYDLDAVKMPIGSLSSHSADDEIVSVHSTGSGYSSTSSASKGFRLFGRRWIYSTSN